MAKIIVVGEPDSKEPIKKPIKVLKVLDSRLNTEEVYEPTARNELRKAKYIELIAKNYIAGHDLIFVYDDPKNRGMGTLYIGNWNDGVIK